MIRLNRGEHNEIWEIVEKRGKMFVCLKNQNGLSFVKIAALPYSAVASASWRIELFYLGPHDYRGIEPGFFQNKANHCGRGALPVCARNRNHVVGFGKFAKRFRVAQYREMIF